MKCSRCFDIGYDTEMELYSELKRDALKVDALRRVPIIYLCPNCASLETVHVVIYRDLRAYQRSMLQILYDRTNDLGDEVVLSYGEVQPPFIELLYSQIYKTLVELEGYKLVKRTGDSSAILTLNGYVNALFLV